VKFSLRDGLRPPVGLRRKESKPAIASHKNCRRPGVQGKSWWLFRTFQFSVDQLIMLTIQALSALAQVWCVGRTRNIREGGMTDASLVPIRRTQVCFKSRCTVSLNGRRQQQELFVVELKQ